MDDIMIKVRDVSMKFNLNIDQGFSVKQAIIELFSPKKRAERKANLERNNFWALQDINFDTKRGEVVGLVGNNHNGEVTHLEPDILECEVKWALGSITMNKASVGDRIPAELLNC